MESEPIAEAPVCLRRAAVRRAKGENAADEWRAYAGVDDELHVFCKQCAVRELGTGP